jgi:hypothetical protein
MKRIAASVGLVALGASGIQAADTANLSSMQTSKPWSVSATLRGFYDDNINTTKDNKVHVFGFEVSPSVGIGIAGEQTSASLGYTYSGKYYDHQPAGNTDKWDHTHTFDAGLSHTFSPRAQVGVRDSFVIGQEPDILRAGETISAFQRISGDNIRNYGSIVFNAEATPLLGFEVGYGNAWYDYDNAGATIASGVIQPSRSGVLDRMEHSGHIDSRWHINPQTTAIFGYQYSQTEYLGDEDIQGTVIGAPGNTTSQSRNNRSHYVYGGVEHNFTPDLSGSFKLGAQYIDYFNDPSFSTEWSPYAQASLRYLYMVDSSVEVGVMHQRSATDVVGLPVVSGAGFVHDQEATTAYGSIRHRITPKLYGSLMGTYQHSTLNGGGALFDEQTDNFYLVGLNLEYRFNPHLSAHAGYNYDRLESDLPGREFTRNRVYVGVTASY